MSEVKHMAGEWTHEDGDEYVREAATGATIARVCEDDGHVNARARRQMPVKANARLIAAAPSLKGAIEAAIPILLVAQAEANKRLDNAFAERCAATIGCLSAALAMATKGGE